MRRLLTNDGPQGNSSLTDRQAVVAAYQRIRSHVRHTPVLDVQPKELDLDAALKQPVVFKLEFLQHSGSFKARGAFNNLLGRDVPDAGVVAASGGNHGAAVAYAAMVTGKPAHIFVPSISSPAKMERIKRYGADLVVGGERYADALAASEAFAKETGAMQIHAYDQEETLAGQGTVALEFANQSRPDTILVACGGGGLIGGMAAYLQGEMTLVSVEPEEAPTLYNAMKAGKPVESPAGGVAAESLAPKQVGDLMFPLAQKYVSQNLLVSDAEILRAQSELWEKFRIVVEPGGAAAYAALAYSHYVPEPEEKVGVLLCGANSHVVNFDT